MVRKPWTRKQRMYLIFCVLIEIFWVIGSISTILQGNFSLFNSMVYVLTAGVFGYLIYNFSAPVCMKVVRGKLSLKDLRSILAKEHFSKVNVKSITKGYMVSDICVSKHWVYIADTYIPKKMISHLSAQESRSYSVIYIHTTTAREIRVADIPNEMVKKFVRLLKKNIPEINTEPGEVYDNFGKNYMDISKKEYRKLTKEQFKTYANI